MDDHAFSPVVAPQTNSSALVDSSVRQPAKDEAGSDAKSEVAEAPAAPPELPVRRPLHFPCFNGLRAIAAMAIVVIHVSWVSGFTLRSPVGLYISRLDVGVAVFFMCSGFLLYRPFAASHLSDRADPAMGNFWVRRILRIVPAYWFILTILTYGLHLVSLGRGWQGVLSHYFFLQIYIPSQSAKGIGPAWTLCTEASFYLILPLYAFLVGLRRSSSAARRLIRELIGVAVLIGISIAYQWWVTHIPILVERHGHKVPVCVPHCLTDPPLSTTMMTWLPALLDTFALGILLAILSSWFRERGVNWHWLGNRWMPAVSWLGAVAAYWILTHLGISRDIIYLSSPGVSLEHETLNSICALLLLLPAVFGPQDRSLIRRFLRCWPVASIGAISYSLYLWHAPFVLGFEKMTGKTAFTASQLPFWVMFLGVASMSLAAATVSYFGVELPFLKMKGRIGWWHSRPRRADPPSSPPPALPASSSEPLPASSA